MYSEEEMIYYVERMWAEGFTPTAASKKWGGLTSQVSLCRWAYLAEKGTLDAKNPLFRERVRLTKSMPTIPTLPEK